MKSNTKCKQLLLILFVFIFSAGIAFGQNCGDINDNGSTDIIDALLVAQCYVGLISCPSADISDVNCDGVIDILDALLIAQLYVDLINTLDCCATPTPTPGEYVTLEMQAEDATWSDGDVENEYPGYTGSGYVDTVNSEGVWIEWTIDVDSACNATCVFRYAVSGFSRPMDLTVNNNIQARLRFPDTEEWSSWSTESADILLSAGSNAIRLTAIRRNGAPNMDKMDITVFGCSIVAPTPTPDITPPPTTPTPDPETTTPNPTPDPETPTPTPDPETPTPTPTPDPETPTPIPTPIPTPDPETPTPTPTLYPGTPTPIPVCTPQINSITPNIGTQGSYILINGTCFGTSGIVRIGDYNMTIRSWIDTEIDFEIPFAQSPGVYDVIIITNDDTSYVFPQLFEYAIPELTVTEVITAHVGDQLTLTGRHFGSVYSQFKIYFRPQDDIYTLYLAQMDSWYMNPESGDSTCQVTITADIPTGEYFIQGRNLIDWSELYDGLIIIE